MGYKAPTHEKLNARWRKYICKQCGKFYEAFTVSPVQPDSRICYLCQKQHALLEACHA